MFRDYKNKIPVYIIAVIAALFTYFLSSNYYLGFSPDSVTYFETANSLISGKGFTDLNGKFVNHWPPGYPVFIFIISWILGIPTILSGIIGNAIIVFFTILILFEIFDFYKFPAQISYSLLSLYLLAPISHTYIWFLSEGLFILLTLLSFLFFTKWRENHSKFYLFMSALILGISFLVRYAGIGFFLGYVFFFLLWGMNKSIKMLISNLSIFIISFLSPILPWILYTRLHGIASHDRKFDFEIIPLSKVQEMSLSFGSWIFGNLSGLLFLCFSIFILTIIYKRKLQYSLNRNLITLERHLILPLTITVIYIFFILFSASFLDHAIPLSNRIFSPVYPFFLLWIGSVLIIIYRKISIKLSYILPFLILVSYSFRSLPVYINHYNEGSGFTSRKFQNSLLISYVKENLQEKILYTNDTFLLKIFTRNRHIKQLPVIREFSLLKQIKPLIDQQEATIIYFESIDWRNYVVSKKTVLQAFENTRIIKFPDGFILVIN